MANKWEDIQKMTEEELIVEANTGLRGQGATIEMLRRIGLVAQQKTMRRLTWVIAFCTALLLVTGGIQIYLQWLLLFE